MAALYRLLRGPNLRISEAEISMRELILNRYPADYRCMELNIHGFILLVSRYPRQAGASIVLICLVLETVHFLHQFLKDVGGPDGEEATWQLVTQQSLLVYQVSHPCDLYNWSFGIYQRQVMT